MPHVELDRLTKRFGAAEVISDLSLAVEVGRVLRAARSFRLRQVDVAQEIAGLEEQHAGGVLVDGAARIHGPPPKAADPMVFQSYALYPHMTVRRTSAPASPSPARHKREIEEKSPGREPPRSTRYSTANRDSFGWSAPARGARPRPGAAPAGIPDRQAALAISMPDCGA